MRKHATPAVFVPHAGCKNRCSFCNQHAISGATALPTPDTAAEAFRAALNKLGSWACRSEIAYFGGSFTALDRYYRQSLLAAARSFVGPGKFMGIRISTRPDCIDERILNELKHSGVTSIELGAQSMDDEVLAKNLRGHTARDVEQSARAIKAAGFSLGLQMLTGLPGDSNEGAVATARTIAALQPDTVRIYPAITLRGTLLHKLYESGEYRPQTLDEATALCADLLRYFDEIGIPVIRLGLHDRRSLTDEIVSGPYHPAFRELCHSRIFLENIMGQIEKNSIPKGEITISIHPRSMSQVVGQRRANINKLADMGYHAKVQSDENLRPNEIEVR